MYDASGYVGATHISGDSLALLRQQLTSRRYWQRPDASHVRVDPSRRSLDGTIFGVNHSKLSGKHWLWDMDYSQESPGVEPNDFGAYGNVDNRRASAQVRWRETHRGHGTVPTRSVQPPSPAGISRASATTPGCIRSGTRRWRISCAWKAMRAMEQEPHRMR
ncbi:MAG: hypothetical protein M3Q09_06415 [Gemmatimonadota bacterium]|nr:hypothetical protein [Gemmatimonadota bacterium]